MRELGVSAENGGVQEKFQQRWVSVKQKLNLRGRNLIPYQH